LRSRASETCLLSLKVWVLDAHVLTPVSAEHLTLAPESGHTQAVSVGGLIISCMIYCRTYARIFILLSEHPKQAEIVLSPCLFTTSIHGSDQWPESKLFRSMTPMLCFLLRIQAPEKMHIWRMRIECSDLLRQDFYTLIFHHN